MAERDDDPIRQRNADRGDAMNEPAGVDQERANDLDLTAVERQGALAEPVKPSGGKHPLGDGKPATTLGSPAADPQQMR